MRLKTSEVADHAIGKQLHHYMKIEFLNPGFDSFPWLPIVLYGLVWLSVLYRILTRPDFDTLTTILWVVVVIFVPIFGVLLYWAASPTPSIPFSRRIIPGSDVPGTPWADDPNYTSEPRSDVSGIPWADDPNFTNKK